jgi:predicted small metal-binding protein
MAYELACGDVISGCAATFSAESKDDLMQQVGAHASADHGIEEVTPEIAEQVEAKIRTTGG